MKNKKTIIVLILVVLLIISAIFLLKKSWTKSNDAESYPEELDNNSKELVAVKAYMNYAWGFQYKGKAIFNDGTIYKWDYSGQGSIIKNVEEHKNWILKNGTQMNKKVSEKDLKELEQNINNLEGTYEAVNESMDAGSNFIKIWKDGVETKIKESGDYTGENSSKTAQQLIKIINKYL